MKHGLIFFAGGAIVGGIVGWLVSKKKYEKELANLRNEYADLDPIDVEGAEIVTVNQNDILSGKVAYSGDLSNLTGVLTLNGYSGSPVETPEDSEPYMIAPERFEADGIYAKAYVTYNALEDELLGPDGTPFDIYEAHDDGESLTTGQILGDEFLEEVADPNGADLCYIRNPSLQYDFEVDILR